MEYWRNPIKTYTWPCNEDPIVDSFHNGQHCLFFDPAIDKNTIAYKQSLQDICDWANYAINDYGISGFVENKLNWYDIANIVKLNMWVDDIKKQGIIKPMLLFYEGNNKLGIHNGESRLRALTCVPSMSTIAGFITIAKKYADKFSHLEQVTTFDQFANICKADLQQEFMFTLTDPAAPYGIFWYEFNSKKTAPVTPGEDACVIALENFLNQHPDTKFTTEWFSNIVDWNNYGLTIRSL
jgi:hypothetical protein